ncbi:hypothetical protein JMJ35_002808 [Cladonia borealis]|uniref:Uncharacterized protein n=1 Tax=Cladonia borealis TaxID=184061 RepID=A0AA39R666_9LECA|nr:hypothetical protein JMJ35_002808 [Cladonia borealis]
MTSTVTIPLTTIFTPPPSCLGVITYDGVLFWQNGVSQTGDSNCYPASFHNIYNSYYSPGICPQSWTSASTYPHANKPLETAAFCCPSSYFVYSTTSEALVDFACASLIGTDLANVFSTSMLSPGPLPTSPSLETVTQTDIPPGSNTVWADLIQIRWQSTDTDVMNLMRESEKTAAVGSARLFTASPAATSSTVPSPTPSSQSNDTTPSSSRLSTGSKVGIGVSAALNAVLLVVVALVYFHRRRKSETKNSAADYATEAYKREPGTAIPVEMDVNNTVELETTPNRPAEMNVDLFGGL